jgi:hypothetical protein
MNPDRGMVLFADLTLAEEAALHAWWRRLTRLEHEALTCRELAKRAQRVAA